MCMVGDRLAWAVDQSVLGKGLPHPMAMEDAVLYTGGQTVLAWLSC